MKALIIVLLLAGLAWANDDWRTCPHGAVCDGNGKCSCLYNASLTIGKTCMTSCVDWTILDETTCECIVKKGHCPYCGAKAIEDTHGLQVIKGNEVLWTIRRCPAGHLFWEKG